MRLDVLVGDLLDFEGDPDALRVGTEGVAVEDQVGGFGVAEGGSGGEAGGGGVGIAGCGGGCGGRGRGVGGFVVGCLLGWVLVASSQCRGCEEDDLKCRWVESRKTGCLCPWTVPVPM